MADTCIKRVSGEEVKNLRIAVFSTEQRYPKDRLFDCHEKEAIFYGFFSADEIFGCCRLYRESANTVHIDNIAFSPKMRGKGFGKKFILDVAEKCFETGFKRITINAKKEAVGFYLKCGFEICGDEFADENFVRIPVVKSIL